MIDINYGFLSKIYNTITCKSSNDEYISGSPQIGIVGIVIYTLEGQTTQMFLKNPNCPTQNTSFSPNVSDFKPNFVGSFALNITQVENASCSTDITIIYSIWFFL